MQFVDPTHHQLARFAERLRSVIRARSRDTDKPDLLPNRQRVATVDHRFALSNPALLSAPLKT
ncbi:hypothetical protein [Caballeronia telluris]|uniref:hypothetical protein n=1 Tax=Caballeronia telluris TaxID=326475 RepID=UPI000F73C6A6|nr:hypothetical protein [Caballeronia telluris]